METNDSPEKMLDSPAKNNISMKLYKSILKDTLINKKEEKPYRGEYYPPPCEMHCELSHKIE